jgi:hypothetical protein
LSNLLIVVFTQNILCKIIPNINKNTNTYENLYPVIKEIIYAPIIVITTSTIATPNKRYECTPLFGSPNIFLYLHKLIIYTQFLNFMSVYPNSFTRLDFLFLPPDKLLISIMDKDNGFCDLNDL